MSTPPQCWQILFHEGHSAVVTAQLNILKSSPLSSAFMSLSASISTFLSAEPSSLKTASTENRLLAEHHAGECGLLLVFAAEKIIQQRLWVVRCHARSGLVSVGPWRWVCRWGHQNCVLWLIPIASLEEWIDERMWVERFHIASCRNKMLPSLALNIIIFFLFYMQASFSDRALRWFLEIRTQAMSTGPLELQWIIIHLFLNAQWYGTK